MNTDAEPTEDTGAKRGTAKANSLVGQTVAAVFVLAWSSYKFYKEGVNIDVWDIVTAGLGIVGCFSPVYLSLILDKVAAIKNGGIK